LILPKPHSLRARLLWFLLMAVVAIALLQASMAYRSALAEADELFDIQMRQMALSLSPGIPVGGQLAGNSGHADEDHYDFVIQVWTVDGLSLFQSTARAALPQRAVMGFSTVKARGTTYRLFSFDTGSQVIQVAQDERVRQTMAAKLALRTVIPTLALVPLLMILVWWVVSSSLVPVRRVQQQVAARQVDELGELAEETLPDEIRPLVHEFNLLFRRVTQAFDAQKNFVADAAHELRTPLAALKLQVQALRRAGDEASRDTAIARLNAGIDRATRLIEQLLMLARQQSGTQGLTDAKAVDLIATAKAVLTEMAPLAESKQLELGIDPHGNEPMWVPGQPDALRILVRNLVDNAIKYTPVGGHIRVTVDTQTGPTRLIVEDSGPGIAPADRHRVLDRFYRVAGSEVSGSGLGLAIVKTVADAHQASVTLDESDALGGLRLTVQFPPAV
jgi:two-component system, OmpR family, sensor kinase